MSLDSLWGLGRFRPRRAALALPLHLSLAMFTIEEIKSDQIALQVLPYGHTFQGLAVTSPRGLQRDALIAPHDPAAHHLLKGRRFINPTVGRYANRLPSGSVRFGVEKEGQLELAGDGEAARMFSRACNDG